MPIPSHVGFDGVETSLFDLLEAITPKRFRTTKIMKRSTIDNHVMTIYRHALSVVTDAVRMRELRGLCCDKTSERKKDQSENVLFQERTGVKFEETDPNGIAHLISGQSRIFAARFQGTFERHRVSIQNSASARQTETDPAYAHFY